MYTPTTISELADIMRGHAGPVTPMGSGLHQALGHAPVEHATAIHVTGLTRVNDYIASDLTVTVEAGMTLGNLQAMLHVHRQWLPWDAPQHQHATIGGLLAAGLSGPLRHSAGTPRDWVLGMKFVTGDGRIIKSGGKVVKNVAGYDMHKLHIGALGTLGIIAEVSFKVAPLPEADEVMRITCAGLLHAHNTAFTLRAPPYNPSALIIEATPQHIQLWGRWQGVAAAVARNLTFVRMRNRLAQPANLGAWEHLVNQPFAHQQTQIRIGCAPQRLPELYPTLSRIAEQSSMHILPTVGLVRIFQATLPDMVALQAAVAPLGGYVVVEMGQTAARWGSPPANLEIMQRIKTSWDPGNKLNRNRFIMR